MAVFEYTVEGIYEIDKGSGVDLKNFEFKIKLARFTDKGAGTHILRRFLPILIREQKNGALFSKIRHWLITDVKKVSDDFPLGGKEIAEMNEQEIQELACMYDLYEIPLPATTSITELREKAQIAYMKKVLKIPMATVEEQAQNGYFVRQDDGSLKFDLGENKLCVKVFDIFSKKRAETKKLTIDDYERKLGLNDEDDVVINEDESKPENKGGILDKMFPSFNDLNKGE